MTRRFEIGPSTPISVGDEGFAELAVGPAGATTSADAQAQGDIAASWDSRTLESGVCVMRAARDLAQGMIDCDLAISRPPCIGNP